MAVQFSSQQMLPDILKKYPQVRPVFDRYGLKGCGGKSGPSESVQFFAQTHGVDEEQLMRELAEAVKSKAPVENETSWADGIYRYFFGAGILIALSAGALLGTWFMFEMGSDGSYFAPGIHRMNAHAHAMVYGFVGAFVMGFGYQALPRFKHTTLTHPKLAGLSFVLLMAGVGARFFGEFFGHSTTGFELTAHPAGVFASVTGTGLEFVAFALFAFVLLRTYRASGKALETYDWFVLGSLFWFIVSLAMSAIHYLVLTNAANFGEMTQRIALLQDPLRNVQLFGAITFLVFGVMLRFLPPVFGFRNPDEKWFRRLFWVVNAGLVLMVVAFPLSVAAKRGWLDASSATSALRGVYYLGALALGGGLLGMSIGFRPWRRVTVKDRSVKFVRAAHLWLGVSLLMLLAEPIYIGVVLGGFGHGFHGGMRHALTLGFVTMMIVAVSTKVVPTLNGIDTVKLSKLWPVFGLLNLAVIGRVGFEVASDFEPGALAWMAPAGIAVILALLFWGAHLVSVMRARTEEEEGETDTITPNSKVGAVVERWPDTLPVFIEHGFGLLSNPVARRTIARKVSLEQVCKMHGKDVEQLVADLNAAAGNAVDTTTGQLVDPDMSVAEAARTWPETAPVFAEYHMDACCGGADTIANAAAHNGHELAQVLARLDGAIRKVQA